MVVGVVGCGRFGSLWARILSQRHTVIAVDPFKAPDETEEPEAPILVSVEELFKCEIVFLCTPISAIENVISTITPHIPERCILADTCSVKEYPLQYLESSVPEPIAIIGTHPLFGPDSFEREEKSRVLVCRSRASDAEFAFFQSFLASHSFALHEMSAHEHDKLMAHTQCITHLIGRLLGKQELPKSEYATMGYRALLELVVQTGSDTEQLFLDMQTYNAYTQTMRKQFLDATKSMIQLIDSQQKSILQVQDGKAKATGK